MAAVHHQPKYQPTCEDCSDDSSSEDHGIEFSGRSPSAPAEKANVAAKRSHPSDLGKSPAQEKVPINIDLQSDSGYSSHTAATMSSADSAPSAKSSHSPPNRPASVAASSMPPPSPATTAMRRRPTNASDDRKHSQNSPRKPLQRTSSVSSSRRPKERRYTATEKECTVPDCECGRSTAAAPSSSSRSRRVTESSPLDSGLDISYPPFDQRSQRSDPASSSYAAPPSPTYIRQPVPYQQGSAMVQPAQTRRRSSSTNRRPMSYHGDPGQGYWVPGMPTAAPFTPSTPQEHGPPLAMARYNMPPQHMPSYPVGPPTPGTYFPNGQMSQFDMRPPMSRGPSSNYVTRAYPPPVVTQDRTQYSARYPSGAQSARQERFPQFEDETSESEDSSSEEEERTSRNSRALVTRPKPSNEVAPRRPSLRHANTQPVARRLSQSQAPPLERPLRERDPRASRVSTAAPSRAPSTSRPTLIQQPKAQSYETTRNARVVVENARSRRRQSYQGYENTVRDKVYDNQGYDKQYIQEQKRRNRDSRVYRDERDDRDARAGEQEIVPIANNSRRRPTELGSRRREEAMAETNKFMDAEAYQQRVRGSYDPFTEQVHKAATAKKTSRMPSGGGSENGSSRSKGSDRASRMSQSNRTAITSGSANGEIRLRVDPTAPLTLSFNGDMEGRTLQINPAEDGMADIVIGNSRGDENIYRNQRASISGPPPRKAIMANQARREAEEQSVKSSRSAHSRREGERRVLRRRRDTEYN